MRLLRDTNIDFMKYRKFWVTVSLALIAVGVVAFNTIQLKLGIDFAGGTQMTLRFRDKPQVDQLRNLLAGAGMGGASIQRFGDEKDNEVIIRTALAKGEAEGSRVRIVAALNRRYDQGGAGRVDLNQVGVETITQLLAAADPDHVGARGPEAAQAHYAPMAKSILELRRQLGLFPSWNEVARAPGLSRPALAALQQRAFLGEYAVLGVESVGPQIGKELRQKGIWAVVLSLLGMLAYIWLRFELRFGVGAVMASIHDVLITLGAFVLMGFEFNLTTIAAFLTLVGYSMNDTVVIFDRIRENMRKSRRKPLIEVMNESINQTLSRTIMTSGLTMLTVAALLALGGDVLRGFAFVMTVGIIVGTYSSVYIASPFALLWEQLFGTQARVRRESPAGAAAPPAADSASRVGGAPAGTGKAGPRRPAGAGSTARPRSSARR